MPKVEKARNTLSVETKKARNKIPVETKINILDALKKGMKRNEVAEEFGVPYSTVRTIESLEAKIRQTYANGTSESSRISSYIRDPVIEKTEKCLSIFIEDCAQKKIPLSGDLVKEKAGQIYELVLRDASTPSTEDTHRFKASTGWLYGFLHRYSLHNVRTKGESASADTEAAEKFLPVFMKEVEEGGYLPDQVFDCDESGVWWKKMPDRTFVPKSQTSAAGFKAAKDKITILLCSNASGDKLMKPLLINKSARPRSMQKVDFNKLPVFWRHNSKAWMTRVIFTDWFETCFVPEVKSYLQEKGLPFRVLLLLDNASSHTLIDHPNIKMMFLPPNTTSILQPLDMGINATFKKLYVKQAFRFILDMIEADPKLKLTEAWKNFTIYDCVRFVGSAAQAVKKSTLNGCWRPLWPGVVRDKKEMSSDLDTHIVRLGDKLVPGFDQADLEEMLKENPMSDEELMDMIEGDKAMETEEDHLTQSQGSTLSRDVVVKGLEMADDLANFFVDNDPYLERAVAFKKELNDLVKRYADLTSNSSDDTTSQLQPTNGHDDDLAQPGPSKVELSYHSDEDNSELRLLYESDSE